MRRTPTATRNHLVRTAFFGGALLLCRAAQADDKGFPLQLYENAITPGSFLTIDSAEVPGHKRFGLALNFGYQRNPFSVYMVNGGSLTSPTPVVRDQMTGELTAA